MADSIIDSFSYSDNGRVIRKDTWRDDQGQQWDTFTTVGQDSSNSANGTVLGNQGSAAQSVADQYYGAAQRDNSTQNAGNDPAPNRNNGGLASRQPEPASSAVPQPYYPPQTPTSGSSAYPLPIGVSRPGGSNVSVPPVTPFTPPMGTGSNPAAPVQGPPNAGGTNAVAGSNTLYNWENPTQALVNTMRANGQQFNVNNPAFQMMMRAAPGLADAYLIRGAGQNSQSSDLTGDFSNFLRDAVNQGNIPTLLKQAQQSLPGMMSQVRNYQNAGAGADTNPLASNQLLGSLSQILGTNNGAGLMDVLANLTTPTLNRTTAGAYNNLLAGPTGLGSQATYNLGSNLMGPNADPTKDFWYYLLGQ